MSYHASPALARPSARFITLLSTSALALAPVAASAQEYRNNHSVIGVTEAIQQLGNFGAGVTVGVIDGIVAPNHPDIPVSVFDKATGVSYPAAGDNHGTHIAGTISARLNGTGAVGIAPQANIVSLGAFASGGWAGPSTSSWLTKLRGYGGNIANMSFGPTAPGDAMHESDIYAFANHVDILLAKAAGNDGQVLKNEVCMSNASVCRNAAASLGHLMIVGALNSSGTGMASFSNTPGNSCFMGAGDTSCAESNKLKYFFLAAPGSSIYATLPNASYGFMSGTSMATPHVAGAAALVMGQHPHLKADPASVAQILFRSADDLGAAGVDEVYGQGRLNVARALQPVGTPTIPVNPGPVPTPPATSPTPTPPASNPPPAASNPTAPAPAPTPAPAPAPAAGGGGGGGSKALIAGLIAAPALGAALWAGLRTKTIAMFDDYGRDYGLSLASMVGARTKADALDILQTFENPELGNASLVNEGQSFHVFQRLNTEEGELAAGIAAVTHMDERTFAFAANVRASEFIAATGFRAAPDIATSLPAAESPLHMGLLDAGSAAGYGSTFGPARWSLSVFHAAAPSDTQSKYDSRNGGTGFEFTTGVSPLENVSVGMHGGFISEDGSLLGTSGSGFFEMAGANTAYGGLSGSMKLTETLSVGGAVEMGYANMDRKYYGGIEAQNLTSSAFAFWAQARDLMNDHDRLKLQVSQPVRMTGGELGFRVPVGRTLDGYSTWEAFDVDAESQGQEVRVDLLYATPIWRNWGDLALGVVQRFDAGHVAGEYETIALMRLNRHF